MCADQHVPALVCHPAVHHALSFCGVTLPLQVAIVVLRLFYAAHACCAPQLPDNGNTPYLANR